MAQEAALTDEGAYVRRSTYVILLLIYLSTVINIDLLPGTWTTLYTRAPPPGMVMMVMDQNLEFNSMQ